MADKGFISDILQEKGLRRTDADMRSVKFPVKTKITEDGEETEVSDEVHTELPFSLADAVLAYGENEVFKRFVNAQVVFEQGQKRNELRSKGSGRTRSRASYFEVLDM